MKMKEQITDLLGGFLEKHKNYSIELCVKNAITNSMVANITIVKDRSFSAKDKLCCLNWDIESVVTNQLSFQYDEVMDCYIGYLEPDMRDMFQHNVIVMMKNGMRYEFECFGLVA